MKEMKNLLLKELHDSKKPDVFWDEVMTFIAEQLNIYFETVDKTGFNILIQPNEGQETIKEKLSKDIEELKDTLAMLSRFNHHLSNLKQESAEKDKEIERLNKEVENATNYLDIKEKELKNTKVKIEQDLSKKLEHARTQINAIIELSNQADSADTDTIKMLPGKVSLNAKDVARILKENKLWPEEEKLTQIESKKESESEQEQKKNPPKGSNNSTNSEADEANSEQLSFDANDPKNKGND